MDQLYQNDLKQLFVIIFLKTSMSAIYQDADLLRKIGIKVPTNQVAQTLAMFMADAEFARQIQSIKASMSTMVNEDLFIDCMINSHRNISEVPDNSKVIQSRDNTFSIRAINPENIKSLTERAFFNSFNLDRNVLNDLEEEIKLHKNSSYRPKEGKQTNCNENNTNRGRADNEEEWKCICNKNIPGSQWVQCCNQEKCRGSNWYHVQCTALEPKDIQNLKDINYICESCKRDDPDDQSISSELRKRNKDQISGNL